MAKREGANTRSWSTLQLRSYTIQSPQIKERSDICPACCVSSQLRSQTQAISSTDPLCSAWSKVLRDSTLLGISFWKVFIVGSSFLGTKLIAESLTAQAWESSAFWLTSFRWLIEETHRSPLPRWQLLYAAWIGEAAISLMSEFSIHQPPACFPRQTYLWRLCLESPISHHQ